MLKHENVVLELLEYKLKDLEAGLQVAGGVSSIWELYHYLNKDLSRVPEQDHERVAEAGRSLKRLTEQPKKSKDVLQTLESLIIEDFALVPNARERVASVFDEPPPILDMDPEVLEEQAVLQRLAKRVWWTDMESVVQDLATRCRAEKTRATARLLYALNRNLERHLRSRKKITDVGLGSFEVLEAVPERLDPLISLNDLESLGVLIRDVIEMVVALGEETGQYGTLDMPRGQALGYVRRMALAIAKDPYAGNLTPTKQTGPNSKQLRLAIEEIGKEALPDDQKQLQREALEERLRVTAAQERQQRDVFQRDVQTFTAAVQDFFNHLEHFLPGRLGGEAGDPQLIGGVLFAINPALRIKAIPRNATSVTVRLQGPTRFMLAGLEFAITGDKRSPSLFVADQSHALQPRLKLEVGRHAITAVHEGQYLHLKVLDEGRSLATLLSEALAVYFVLNAKRKDELLRLLKTAANVSVSEPQELVGQALDRLREMSSRAPDRRQALDGLLRGAARANNLSLPDNLLAGLVRRFLDAMSVGADDLDRVLEASGSAQTSVHYLSDDPLSLSIAGQPVTVRKYGGHNRAASGHVVVMLPGRIVGSFNHYMVQPFPGGTLICARAEDSFASLFFVSEHAGQLF